MATTGLVLVHLEAGRERDAIEKIKKIDGVKGVTGVFGSWDAIATIEAKDLETLAGLVVGRVRAVLGVVDTETLIEVKV